MTLRALALQTIVNQDLAYNFIPQSLAEEIETLKAIKKKKEDELLDIRKWELLVKIIDNIDDDIYYFSSNIYDDHIEILEYFNDAKTWFSKVQNELRDKIEDEYEDSPSEYHDIVIKPTRIENDNSILYEIEQRILFLIDEAYTENKTYIVEKVSALQWFGTISEKDEFLQSLLEYISHQRDCYKRVVHRIEYV